MTDKLPTLAEKEPGRRKLLRWFTARPVRATAALMTAVGAAFATLDEPGRRAVFGKVVQLSQCAR